MGYIFWVVRACIGGVMAWAGVASALAAECPHSASAAGYIAHYQQRQGDRQAPLDIVRTPGWVAYDSATLQPGHSLQLWHRLPGDHAEMYRVFPDAQRRILYTVSSLDLKGKPGRWSQVEGLIDPAALAVVNTQASDCGAREQRRGRVGDNRVAMRWYPRSGLIETLTIRPDDGAARSYQLLSVDNADAAERRVQLMQAYQTTDFADIGDNESDPFLRRMIRLGFVEHAENGVYDSDGRQPHRH